MNRWQAERQIAYLLSKATWPDSPNDPLLKNTLVTSRRVDEFYTRLSVPFATVHAIDSEPDAAIPSHASVAHFEVTIVAQNVSDPWGMGAIVGQNRGGLGMSQGRGVDEILEECQKVFLLGALMPLTDSAKAIQCHVQGIGGVETIADSPGVVKRSFMVVVYNVTTSRYYHNALGIKQSGSAPNFSWSLPPDRYDLIGVKVIRKSGFTPSASPSDGTDLNVAYGITGFFDVPGSGSWTYTFFGVYDESSSAPTSVQRWSSGTYFNVFVP